MLHQTRRQQAGALVVVVGIHRVEADFNVRLEVFEALARR
jgi:hypothetical protein